MTLHEQGRTVSEVLRESLEDPGFRKEWERTFLAETVALELAAYRARHGMSQADLATRLGMKQAAIARMEAAEHTPTMTMLARLSRGLKIAFTISITPSGAGATVSEEPTQSWLDTKTHYSDAHRPAAAGDSG